MIPGIKLYAHKKNIGKGAAIRTGLKYAKGEIIIVNLSGRGDKDLNTVSKAFGFEI